MFHLLFTNADPNRKQRHDVGLRNRGRGSPQTKLSPQLNIKHCDPSELRDTMSHENEPPSELDDGESYDLTPAPDNASLAPPSTKSLDLHWKPASRTVDETLADGLSNEDLWMLIRRFNKVCL